jgi:xanthine dehydrogenase YagS FAD-binding subunit
MSATTYTRPESLDQALGLTVQDGATPLAGGTDVVTRIHRRKLTPEVLVDLRGVLPAAIVDEDGALRIGAGATIAAVAEHAGIAERYAALSQASQQAASPQLRQVGTVGGNLAQHVRCWYYRHPDLRCWLNGGDTCYAQIGDHRKHGLEPGDCISVAPSDLAAALGALGASVELRSGDGSRSVPLLELYRRPSEEHRSAVALRPGELIVAVELPRAPEVSAYARAGERAAWSFALVGVAAARFAGGERHLVAIGVTNEPRALDPDDPLRGLDGLEQTRWKRTLLGALCERALAAVA